MINCPLLVRRPSNVKTFYSWLHDNVETKELLTNLCRPFYRTITSFNIHRVTDYIGYIHLTFCKCVFQMQWLRLVSPCLAHHVNRIYICICITFIKFTLLNCPRKMPDQHRAGCTTLSLYVFCIDKIFICEYYMYA